MSNSIEDKLSVLRQPFIIKEDGTSQTQRYNKGRVGFYFEKIFGITPNKDRRPDFGEWELKTVRLGGKITIGTLPDFEVKRICCENIHSFKDSDPYTKMKNTFIIVYSKISSYPEDQYVMHGWGSCKLENLSPAVTAILQKDYETICKEIKRYSGDQENLTKFLIKYGTISGTYLSLGYKGAGSGGYNYPAWSFTSKFVKLLNHA
jgi:hypothetical protein